ncbi:unnamed protein product [Mucor hiemalis]
MFSLEYWKRLGRMLGIDSEISEDTIKQIEDKIMNTKKEFKPGFKVGDVAKLYRDNISTSWSGKIMITWEELIIAFKKSLIVEPITSRTLVMSKTQDSVWRAWMPDINSRLGVSTKKKKRRRSPSPSPEVDNASTQPPPVKQHPRNLIITKAFQVNAQALQVGTLANQVDKKLIKDLKKLYGEYTTAHSKQIEYETRKTHQLQKMRTKVAEFMKEVEDTYPDTSSRREEERQFYKKFVGSRSKAIAFQNHQMKRKG